MQPSDEAVVAPPSGVMTAPSVQAVLVAHEPGPWFDEVVSSFALQDYQRLSLLVLATRDPDRIREFVHERLPNAEVRSVDEKFGFGRSANTVLEAETLPAFYLFCHDDVALAPDAVRLLVEESLRSNASIVGPKLVDWEQPNELLEVGLDLDKLGHVAPRIEPGELDQEQHDAVGDVFAVSAAAMLVRADLFEALDGFDAAMGVTGEDVDLCWRAHVAGARIMVVPSAVVRHREGMGERRSSTTVERVRERHRLRSMLSNYGIFHTIRVVPQAIVMTIVRALVALVTGRFGRAASFVSAWAWNLRRPASLVSRRRRLSRLRKVPDSEIRRLQIGGYAPASAFLRGQLGPDNAPGSMSVRARDFVLSLRSGPSRLSLAFWAVLIALLTFGSRHLITRRVPVIGDLVPFDLSVSEQFDVWSTSWSSAGTGDVAAQPTAHALVGALGFVLFGAMGLLRTLLTVGLIPLGAIGMWRMLRPFDSPWIRVVGTAMYVSTPVPYNALSEGVWSALVLYAGLPWVVSILGRAGRLAPFGRLGGLPGPGVYAPNAIREMLGLGLVLALIVAVTPFGAAVVVVLALVLVVGSVLAGWPAGIGRLLGVLGGGVGIAALLHLPWLLDIVLAGPSWQWFAGSRPADQDPIALLDAFRFVTGETGGGILGWALPVAALAPLVLARGDRWAWAVRGWSLYLAGVGAVWLDGKDWIDQALPRPEVLLAPAALGLALAAAMGVAALQRDLRSYKFGWRQLVPLSAVAGIALAVLPTLLVAWPGDWRMPDTQLNRPLTPAADALAGRVLWLGHDDVLAVAGHRLDDQLTIAVSEDPRSSFGDRWAGAPAPADDLLVEAVELALNGGTSRLGRLLAPFGITEVVVVEPLAPPPASTTTQPVAPRVGAALAEQLDMQEIDVVPGVTRYRNTSALGVASAVEQGATADRSLRDFVADPAAVAATLMPVIDDHPARYGAEVREGIEIFAAVPTNSDWVLTIDGEPVEGVPSLDVGTSYVATAGGSAVLEFETPTGRRLVGYLQAGLWLAAGIAVLRLSTSTREVTR